MHPPRRPVPSAAALRVLRQLAYISSGTACGAAALVAEERRRQIHLVGKVAENARKIKQHPRYAHSGGVDAAAAVVENESGCDNWDAPGHWDVRDVTKEGNFLREAAGPKEQKHGYGMKRRAKGQRNPEPKHESWRSGVLPSEVEKGYRRLSALEERISRQGLTSNGKRRALGVTEQQSPSQEDAPMATPYGEHSSDRAPTKGLEDLLQAIQLDIKREDAEGAYRRLFLYSAVQKHTGEVLSDTVKRYVLGPSSELSDESIRMFCTEHGYSPNMLLENRGSSQQRERRVQATVGLFLGLRSYPQLRILSALIVSKLLDQAAQDGLLNEVQNLCSWLLDKGCLTEGHLRILAKRSLHLNSLDPTAVTQCKVQVFINSLAVNPAREGSISNRGTGDVPAFFQAVLEAEGHVAAYKNLEDTCNQLLRESEIFTAADIFVQCLLPDSPKELHQFARSMFSICIDEKLVHHSKSILDWLYKHQETSQAQFDRLFALYEDCSNDIGFLTLLNWKRIREVIAKARRGNFTVPQSAVVAIFKALAARHPKEFALAFNRYVLPHDQDAVLAQCRPACAELILRRWKDTRNFEGVKTAFVRVQNAIGGTRLGIDFYNAMILVCVYAGRLNEAQSYLLQLQDQGLTPNAATFGHLMLAAAKKRDWNHVNALLNNMAQVKAATVPSTEQASIFDPLLREYIRQHRTAEDIWTFTSTAIDEHGVTPTQMTLDLMLEAFVRAQKLRLIPKWIRYVKTCGAELRVNSKTAARMIRRYYREYRPSHVLLMSITRKLTKKLKTMMSEELADVLREAAAYDLRNYSGPNAKRSAEFAKARLGMLQGPLEEVPSPVLNTTNTQLPLASAAHCKSLAPPSMDDISSLVMNMPHEASADDHLPTQRREVEMKSLVDLSLKNPSKVVDLYKKKLSVSGLPQSNFSLQLAVEASIQAQSGDTAEARKLLADAAEAGMDVTSALSPVLLQSLRDLTRYEKRDLHSLQRVVEAFYREMDKHQVPVTHQVGVNVANVLASHGRPRDAITLLQFIHNSQWAAEKPLDIVAMTVFLKAYTALAYEEGIAWTIRTVLEKNLRIDRRFLAELADARGAIMKDERHRRRRNRVRLARDLYVWRAMCREQQKRQIKEATYFGNKLVNHIIMCEQLDKLEPIDINTRREYENAEFGAALVDDRFDDDTKRGFYRPNRANVTAHEQSKAGADDETTADPNRGDRSRAIRPSTQGYSRWRAHLRRGLKDGNRLLKFRYKLPGTVAERKVWRSTREYRAEARKARAKARF
ncbi:hypothetical protein H2203_006253 [Taxawa tesnikishii (nom. ined.)]|nr:hypothetical protein H2203_006253 [Dothideales sp. JES 119]